MISNLAPFEEVEERRVRQDSVLGSVLLQVEERFWSKVDKDGPLSPQDGTPCWLWTAALSARTYGQFSVAGKHVKAHRFAYELLMGHIPAGVLLDHRRTCPKRCVRPDHLRPATKKQNMENLTGAYLNSASGLRGVYPCGKKWVARLCHYGQSFYLGVFDTPEEASVVVVAKRCELFTHNDMDRNTA